ncbi:hypothetical protein [Dethiothermospora halolimnae]|uniref:hypothetical protein n=1 Tax=Dethiothermospora halolimnae TaxID=3114390 RepID=UPI003CCC022A
MKNNVINILLLTFIIFLFLGYFIATNFAFNNNIMEQLEMAKKYTEGENWDKVLDVTRNIEKSWNKQKYLVMLNFAEAEFAVFENHLSYIIGGAKGKQMDTTLSHILAAQDLWKNTKKLVPEP